MPGRNDPCPCGSGKKYKKCCLNNKTYMESQGTPNMATEVLNELKTQMEGMDFSSQRDLDDFAAKMVESRNKAPLDYFLGLSSIDMRAVLNTPQGDPGNILSLSFQENLAKEELLAVPVLAQTLFLLKSLGESENGVKATQKGNLPRSLVQDFYYEFRSYLSHYFSKPMGQNDLQELDLLFFVLKELGLIKRRTGRISLTRRGAALLEGERYFEIYGLLFNFYANSYDWLSTTWYEEEFALIQQAMSFGLYIIREKAVSFVEGNDLAALFHRAFPMIDDPQRPFITLFLDRFCFYFGLVERDFNPTQGERGKTGKYRQSSLFSSLLKWNI